MSKTWEGVIGVENKQTVDGRFVDPGAIVWDEGTPIPLYLSGPDGLGMQLIGVVEGVWRDGYLLKARGDFRPEFELSDLHEDVRALGMELDSVIFTREEGEGVESLYLHEGRLRRVCLYNGTKPAWPECRIEVIGS